MAKPTFNYMPCLRCYYCEFLVMSTPAMETGNQRQIRLARVIASYQAAAADEDAAPSSAGATDGRPRKPKAGFTADVWDHGALDEDDEDDEPQCCLGPDEATLRYCPMNESLLPFKLLYVFLRGGVACIMPYLSVFLSLLSLPPSTVGILLGLPCLVMAFVNPVFGFVADKFQCRKAVLLLCLSLWFAFIVSVTFLRPLKPAACKEVVDNLWEVSRTFPKDSKEYQHLLCMVNRSLDEYRMEGRPGGQTEEEHWKPVLSLLQLPDPFSTGLVGTCASTAARDHKDPISALTENIEQFGALFIPHVMAPPNGTSAGIGWLFERASLLQSFVKVFVLMSLGEVMQGPTMALTDTATLNELGEQQWNRYGWQRSFGSAGFAIYSIAVASFLGLMRFPQMICGLEIEIIDYCIGTVMFGGTVACAFGLLFACCFRFKYYTNAEYKFSNVLPALCSGYYGSIMVTALVLAVCNGCVAGYLSWHLRSLGATEITLSLVLAVRAGSELLLAFHTPRLIGCSGHVELLFAGLLVYCLRFLCYALVTNPWMVLPVEVLHGMSIALTWNILVSLLCRAVPFECMATLQGFLSGIYFGLGHGIGAIAGGFMVTSYGVLWTFYSFSFGVFCYAIGFFLAVKAFRPPRKAVTSYQMLSSKDPLW
ncbi:major facilitator superfamily domain-containing protein 6-like [Acanthaster planci]|uniref:Major facilitator superfamily domain-containing protein 6-like n=1 Tax=Acanthaster planci TaxID=133434 RepID=A0A8B7XZ56_ACAPL|nr:major facilitator superfamily domain-containing protein 6-like [Acanthaster planci]